MKTTLHYYICDLSKVEGIREWKRIQRETRGVPETKLIKEVFDLIEIAKLDKHEIELPSEVYSNRFTDVSGSVKYYLHAQFVHKADTIKEGYYLEMTIEMIEARDNTYRCPCCMELKTEGEYFCKECIRDRIENEKDIYKALYRPVSVIDVQPRNIFIPLEIKHYWREHHKQTQTV